MKKAFLLVLAALLLCLAMISCDPKNDNKGDQSGSSTPSIPVATSDPSPDAPFHGEDDAL